MRSDAPDLDTLLSEDMIFGIRRRERLAWSLAISGVLTGLIGVVTAAAILPLKETRAFLAIVDKDTGIAARTVEVQPAGMAETEAVRQSLLFNYVTARETFDATDNDERVLSVWQRSAGQARESLQSLWTEGHAGYPPTVYGPGARIDVEVLAINPINDKTAQIRFEKILREASGTVQTGKFSATVAWKFEPRAERAMTLVWENPLGFTVTGYRVNAETMREEN